MKKLDPKDVLVAKMPTSANSWFEVQARNRSILQTEFRVMTKSRADFFSNNSGFVSRAMSWDLVPDSESSTNQPMLDFEGAQKSRMSRFTNRLMLFGGVVQGDINSVSRKARRIAKTVFGPLFVKSTDTTAAASSVSHTTWLYYAAFAYPADTREALTGCMEERFHMDCVRYGHIRAGRLLKKDVIFTYLVAISDICKTRVIRLLAALGFQALVHYFSQK